MLSFWKGFVSMLHTATPREQSGRDTFGRYRAQIRSTAINALRILESKEIDRVYCDIHDDIVIRLKKDSSHVFIFLQVKTKDKQNHNWTTNDLLNIPETARDLEKHKLKIKDSFLGKLIRHTVIFDESCVQIIFQTNINNSDPINAIIKDLELQSFSNRHSKFLSEKFNEIFISEGEKELEEIDIKKQLSKLTFETDVQYLKNGDDNFIPIARESIYKYSEIDLQREELQEILINLLELISKKTESIIKDWTLENIENMSGISIDDLLDILSISRDAYYSLLNGEDDKAIKNASIIQRMLKNTNADASLVKKCSELKIDWDVWLRDKRHDISILDLESIIDTTRQIVTENLQGSSFKFAKLRSVAKSILEELGDNNLKYNLTEELILGSIFSQLVKDKTWS